MQAQYQLTNPSSQKLVAAAVVAFLVVMAMVPAARATSLVPDGEALSGEASARSSVSNAETIRDQIQFLEDNWYFSDADSDVSEYTADRFDRIGELRAANASGFEATKQAPGLYNDSRDAASPSEESSVDARLAHDEIKFLHDNWYFQIADDDADEHRPQGIEEFEAMERAPGIYTESPEAGDNPAAVEPDSDEQADEHRSQSVQEFEAMERAPDLYTEAPYAGSPATDDSVDAGRAHDKLKFLEDNWHLAPGIFIIEEEDDGGIAPGNPSLSREQIQFMEDNWYLDAGALMQEDDLTDDEPESRGQTREGIQFNEDNWNFNLGEALSGEDADETGPAASSGNNTDRADALAELQNGDDEVVDDRSHDELTYPWGGFLEHDY